MAHTLCNNRPKLLSLPFLALYPETACMHARARVHTHTHTHTHTHLFIRVQK